MAHSRSAKKQIRVSGRKAEYNKKVKSRTKTAIKQVEHALNEGNIELAEEKLVSAISNIDRAASKGIYHKNTAARKKSRLTKRVNKASA